MHPQVAEHAPELGMQWRVCIADLIGVTLGIPFGTPAHIPLAIHAVKGLLTASKSACIQSSFEPCSRYSSGQKSAAAMPVTTRRQQAAVVVGAGRQPAASQADNTSRRHTKEAEDAEKEHQFIEDVIGTGADRQWHACMANALLVHVHKPHVDGD